MTFRLRLRRRAGCSNVPVPDPEFEVLSDPEPAMLPELSAGPAYRYVGELYDAFLIAETLIRSISLTNTRCMSVFFMKSSPRIRKRTLSGS